MIEPCMCDTMSYRIINGNLKNILCGYRSATRMGKLLFIVDNEIEVLVLKIASFRRHIPDIFFVDSISCRNYPIIYGTEILLCRITFCANFLIRFFINIEQGFPNSFLFLCVPNQKSYGKFSSDVIKCLA